MKKAMIISMLLVTVFLAGCAKEIVPKEYDGVNFPLGDLSFADKVISYDHGSGVSGDHAIPENALGPPDYTDAEDTNYASLGNAENQCENQLIVRFDDNYLIDGPGDDLWIFEIGPAVEATEVFISRKGKDWVSLGKIEGSTRGVDIKGKASSDILYRYVRLCDFPDGSTSGSPYAGPDMDAIGAIGADPRCENAFICIWDWIRDKF